MRNLGLERIEVPSDWSKVLEEAWVKRALLWLGQPEADRGVALQLAERRAGPQVPKALPALGWRVWELNSQAQGVYERAFISQGGTLTLQGEPDPESRLCVAASVSGVAEARRLLGTAPSKADSLWLDSFRPLPLDALRAATRANEWDLWGHEFDGRSFQDQVWGSSRESAKVLLGGLRIFFRTGELSLNRAPLCCTRMPLTGLTRSPSKGGWLARCGLTPPSHFSDHEPPNPVGRSVPREVNGLLCGTPPNPSRPSMSTLGRPLGLMRFIC